MNGLSENCCIDKEYKKNSTIVSTVKMKFISGLKMMVKSGLEVCGFFFEVSPCAHHVIFITTFVLLIKIPPFSEVNSFNRKWKHMEEFQKYFF